MTLARIFGAGIAAMLFAAPGHAQEPSFSCNTAELESEVTICESGRLSRLDRRMDQLYREGREAANSNRERRRLRRVQFDWLNERNACGTNRRCLRRQYEGRIGALEQLAASGNQDDDYAAGGGDENPSFSCRNVRKASERTICQSQRLSRMDREMAAVYQDVRTEVTGWRARRKLVRNQRNWVVQRDECARDRRCLRDAYRTRISDLSDVKRQLVPAYQRNAGWRATCSRPVNRGVATVCGTEALWTQYIDVYRAHVAVRDRRRRRSVRAAITEDRGRWITSLSECGRNDRCLRRSMRTRVAAIQERDYLRRDRRPDYQRTEGWVASCSRPRNAGVDTICQSERLWGEYINVYRAYQSTYDGTRRSRVRRRLKSGRADWINSLETCGSNKRCLRRSMSRYTDDLSSRSERRTAAYQRTDTWRASCDRPRHEGLATVCQSEALWTQYIDAFRAYKKRFDATRRSGRRDRLQRDRGTWITSLETCGSNERCLRRKMQQYVAQVEDSRGDNRGDAPRVAGITRACAGRGTLTQQAICSDRKLARLSEELSQLYNSARATLGKRGRRVFQKEQGSWARGGTICGGEIRCLRKRYRDRNAQFRDPAFLRNYKRLR